MGADWSSTARSFLTHPPSGKYFSPTLPSDCFAIDFPWRASSPGEGLPTLYSSFKGSGRGCPLLRASSDHCFIVGALRARRAPGRSLLIFFSILSEMRGILTCGCVPLKARWGTHIAWGVWSHVLYRLAQGRGEGFVPLPPITIWRDYGHRAWKRPQDEEEASKECRASEGTGDSRTE